MNSTVHIKNFQTLINVSNYLFLIKTFKTVFERTNVDKIRVTVAIAGPASDQCN